MNKTEFKNLASAVLAEAFSAHIETWNLNEVEESQLRFALIGPETIERLANVAESYVMQNDGEESLRAHVENVAFPSGKDIKITLSIPSDVPRRLAAAQLAGSNVVIYNEQTTLPVSVEQPEDDNPNQMDIESFVEELEETPDFSEQELVGV